nr:hypothetical protein HmN_000458000 [Hymenolepis microstoma]
MGRHVLFPVGNPFPYDSSEFSYVERFQSEIVKGEHKIHDFSPQLNAKIFLSKLYPVRPNPQMPIAQEKIVNTTVITPFVSLRSHFKDLRTRYPLVRLAFTNDTLIARSNHEEH